MYSLISLLSTTRPLENLQLKTKAGYKLPPIIQKLRSYNEENKTEGADFKLKGLLLRQKLIR